MAQHIQLNNRPPKEYALCCNFPIGRGHGRKNGHRLGKRQECVIERTGEPQSETPGAARRAH